MRRHTVAERREMRLASNVTGQDRLFTLNWKNDRLNIRDAERNRDHMARGVHFSNGYIALNNGASYEMMSELEHVLQVNGWYELAYDDEVSQ